MNKLIQLYLSWALVSACRELCTSTCVYTGVDVQCIYFYNTCSRVVEFIVMVKLIFDGRSEISLNSMGVMNTNATCMLKYMYTYISK